MIRGRKPHLSPESAGAPNAVRTLTVVPLRSPPPAAGDNGGPPVAAEPFVPPDAPDILEGEALVEWHRAWAELAELGWAHKADRAMMAGRCQLWGRWVRAEEELKEAGSLLYKTPSGYVMPSPLLTVANQALKDFMSVSAEFGMTPAARARMRAKLSDSRQGELPFGDELQNFLAGKPQPVPVDGGGAQG